MNTRIGLFAIALLISVGQVLQNSLLAGWVTLFVLSAAISGIGHAGSLVCLQTPTLTTSEILMDVFAAFRKRVKSLQWLATDFSDGRVKFGQQMIAHVASLPSVVDHNQANGFFDTPANAKDLLTDVPVTIDQWKDINLKFRTNDLVADRNLKYLQTVDGAASQLGKAMLDHVLGRCHSGNLSYSATCANASATYAKLRTFTSQLNGQKAGRPRFGLVSPDFMTGLLGDSLIASGDYFGQLQRGDEEMSLNGIGGFQQIDEYNDFPTIAATVGTFTAATTDVVTLAGHGLVNGQRVVLSNSGGALPAGLSAATEYFIRDAATDTFKLAATRGGSAVDITGTGTGTHTLATYENLTGVFFERRAVVIASRLPEDSLELAAQRGVPIPLKHETIQDPESKLTVLALERLNTGTLDLELTFSVMFGSSIGAQSGTAGDLLDRAAMRVKTV